MVSLVSRREKRDTLSWKGGRETGKLTEHQMFERRPPVEGKKQDCDNKVLLKKSGRGLRWKTREWELVLRGGVADQKKKKHSPYRKKGQLGATCDKPKAIKPGEGEREHLKK